MNFSTVSSLTIPEGTVTKITNAAGDVLWSANTIPVDYLTFSAPSAFSVAVSTPGWDGTMYYSTDTEMWSEWDGSEISGMVLYLAGSNNTIVCGTTNKNMWTLTGSDISCSGNIETLLNHKTVTAGKHPTMGEYCYSYMFWQCRSLIKAPELPATTLTKGCYSCMFRNCTSLTTVPALPATTLVGSCYSYMFYGCTSLTTVPALPATTLVGNCYSYMFYGCTAIKLSETQTDEYTQEYRIPISGTISATETVVSRALSFMFGTTGGTFTGAPEINTTYYLHESNTIIPAT